MKKILIVFGVLLVIGVALLLRRDSTISSSQNSPAQKEATTLSQPIAASKPSRLVVPSLGIDTGVEYVGLDSEERMDVPKDPAKVAWYQLGPKPGEKGSAVMAGHLDDPNGDPAVFWNLSKIAIGDEIQVKDTEGKNLIFKVVDVKTYPYNDFPLEYVFADQSSNRLNLITCNGTWDKENNTYLERKVVFSELVN